MLATKILVNQELAFSRYFQIIKLCSWDIFFSRNLKIVNKKRCTNSVKSLTFLCYLWNKWIWFCNLCATCKVTESALHFILPEWSDPTLECHRFQQEDLLGSSELCCQLKQTWKETFIVKKHFLPKFYHRVMQESKTLQDAKALVRLTERCSQ